MLCCSIRKALCGRDGAALRLGDPRGIPGNVALSGLAGGLGPGDASRLARVVEHPACLGIDLNSRFETAPGVKDVAALREFMAAVRGKAGDRQTFREEETKDRIDRTGKTRKNDKKYQDDEQTGKTI